MTNFCLVIHMPTYMHMPGMCVSTCNGLHRGLCFLTLGRRVVVWIGNRSQRSSQERKSSGTKTDRKRDSNESGRGNSNGATISHPTLAPSPPTSPSRNSEL